MEIDKLEAIIKLLKANEVTEFEMEQDGTKLKLVRGSSLIVQHSNAGQASTTQLIEPAVVQQQGNSATRTQSPSSAPPQPEIPEAWSKVESPIVGTFYRRSSPDSEPYVSEGDTVKKGETLCIIEAMKLMNEIEAPLAGRVEKILLNDGQVVEFGETLFFINPSV